MSSKSIIIRFFSIFILTILWYANVLIVAIPFTVWYLYQFRAYEIIFVGLLIDLYFQVGFSTPWYTVMALLAVIFMEVTKPFLRKHKQYEI